MSRPNWIQRVFSRQRAPPQGGGGGSSSDDEDSQELADTSESYYPAPCVDDLDFQLANGVKVKVTNEEVEDVDADVVVIGNDADLSNSASAAQSLLRAGGKDYGDALKRLKKSRDSRVLRCEAGSSLRCQKVYHALFRASYAGQRPEDWRRLLEELYDKACSMARQDGAKTVALVLLGAGKAGGPTRESVRAALEAFSRLPAPGCLTQLLLVERDERTTREAVKECQDWVKEHPAPQQ